MAVNACLHERFCSGERAHVHGAEVALPWFPVPTLVSPALWAGRVPIVMARPARQTYRHMGPLWAVVHQ
jgi:hypothetical protein